MLSSGTLALASLAVSELWRVGAPSSAPELPSALGPIGLRADCGHPAKIAALRRRRSQGSPSDPRAR
eukprot:121662-Alexandrium_andersonii.AAC.1